LIRLDSSRCDPQYIFRILQQAYRSGELDAFQIQSTGITNFRWKLFLDQFVVELPERRVQESVSQVLGLLDDLIKNNRRRVGLLEWMAQAVYQEWFVNFRYPGHESIPLVDSPLGPIPEGWEVGMLDDLLGLQRGFDLPLKNRNPGSVPVIAATGQHGTHEVARAPGPGVVTGRSGSLGTVMYVSEDFWPLNTTLWVKDFRRATPELATYVLRGLGLAQFNSGAAVPTLNRNDVAGQPVAVPPTELVEQFSALARQLLTLIVILQQSSGALRMGRDLLLPHLVSGHIDVSFLDLDAVVESVA
jgi:type I restriction enzyme S subunit